MMVSCLGESVGSVDDDDGRDAVDVEGGGAPEDDDVGHPGCSSRYLGRRTPLWTQAKTALRKMCFMESQSGAPSDLPSAVTVQFSLDGEGKERENNRINFPSGEHNIYRIRWSWLGTLAAVYSAAGRRIHLLKGLKGTSVVLLGWQVATYQSN